MAQTPENQKKPEQLKHQVARFGRGFVYAWNGIAAAVREERNFRFHLVCAVYAFLAAWLAGLDGTGTALIALCVGAVLALELVNSAVERAVDKPDTTHWWTAGAAKDMAAGAVLVMALATLCVACCLLVPRLGTICAKLAARPVPAAALALSLAPAFVFVFSRPNDTVKGKDTEE